MTDTVECDLHGKQQITFVCQHLVESLQSARKVGFFLSREPRGDAWCSACEEIRIREGGESGHWNDRSMAFANIQILCGSCYDKVRAQQEL